MKTESKIKRYSLIAILIALFLLTFFIALVIYRYYDVVVRGILGLIMLYLLYIYGRHSKIDVSLDILLLTPNKGKYLIITFVGGLISAWATILIMEMISFFVKR
jgi:hypothetical protein